MDITTKTARRKLAPRREPYFVRFAKGQFLGYRQSAIRDDGTWIVRYRDEWGQQHFKALGSFDTFDAALKKAKDVVANVDRVGSVYTDTVGAVCQHYVAELKRLGKTGAARTTNARFSSSVYATDFALIPIASLRAHHIKEWQSGLSAPKASSRNVMLATLTAALNLAYREGRIESNLPWRSIRRQKDDNPTARERWLNADERERLLAASAPDFRDFMKGLLETGIRPGALAGCKPEHYDPKEKTLHIPKDKTGPRTVPVSSEMAEFIERRSGGEFIFETADGKQWNRTGWCKAMVAAREAAGLDSAVVVYSARHTFISEAVSNGVEAFVVARLVGTSTERIDKNYGHLSAGSTRAKLDNLKLT